MTTVKRLSTATIHLTPDGKQFELDVPIGGHVIRTRTTFVAKQLIVTMERPPLVPVLQMTFEVNGDPSERERRQYALLAERESVQVTQTLDLIGVVENPFKPEEVMAVYQYRRTECDAQGHVYAEGVGHCKCGGSLQDAECAGGAHTFVPGSEWCMCGDQHVSGHRAEVFTRPTLVPGSEDVG